MGISGRKQRGSDEQEKSRVLESDADSAVRQAPILHRFIQSFSCLWPVENSKISVDF